MTDADSFDAIHDIENCRASHAALIEHLRGLDDGDPASPSLLPGWTVGHVLTHIARNADGHISMLDGRHQYPHGAVGRTADIERGAGRAWSALVADVAETNAELERRWSQHESWGGTSEMLSGTRPTGLLPFLRQREVEIHRVDLGLGYGFSDLPAEYVRRELRMLEMQWRARRPMGMTGLPNAALAASPADRLAWLTGRADINGLVDAGLF